MNHLYLVDASWFIFRAFHAIPILTRADGTPVNAVFGFTNLLMKLLDERDADHVAIVFDSARETFRNDVYPEYKANRPEPPEELVPQFALVREATRAFNLDCIEIPGFEADDLIATYARLAREAGAKVTIVSSDKDLMQVVSEEVTLFDAIRNRHIGVDQVHEKFGVGPEKVVEVQALAGDSTDNVPGVPGIGIKTAAQLIREYGDLESLLARAREIKQPKRRASLLEHAEKARLSRKLVELRQDVPVDIPLESLVRKRPDPEVLLKFLAEQGFQSIIARVQSRLATSETVGTEGSGKRSKGVGHAGTTYELVQDLPTLQKWILRARRAGVVAVDTETTSLDESKAELVGVSLCVDPGHACYIPLAHRDPGTQGSERPAFLPGQIPITYALSLLTPFLGDPSVLKVGHNIKYDMIVLSRYGARVTPVDDTMLLSYVLDGGRHGHSLDVLAELHLAHTTIKYKDVTGAGQSQVTFDLAPLDNALQYAAEDADVTLRLHRVLKPRIVREHMMTVYERLERPLVPVLARMEATGILVDREELKRLSEEFARRMKTLEDDIYTLAGRPFNIGSPKQLGEILFDEMGLEGEQKTDTGAHATGADVLEGLAAKGHILPARVLDWRQIAKLKTTYADALVERIHPETGRVHTSYAMAAVATGRLSSTDPNLQNIPVRTDEGRKIRAAFRSEPEWQLLSLDYSQIELRLLAHIADVGPLKQAFHAGQDIHAITASEIFAVPVHDMDPLVRRKAKTINFGIIYGISAFGLARQLGIEQKEAAAYIQAYFERYPGIKEYMERTKVFCREKGFVETLFGRRCHVQGIHDKNPARRGFAERAAINAPIQGTAADILKRAMIRVPDALARNNLEQSARMLLTVHDELLFEVEEAARERTTDVVRRVMETAALPAVTLDVPLIVDAGHGESWADAH